MGIGLQSAAAQQSASVSIVNFAFDPASLQVPAGTTVTWTNNGGAPHTVTADDGSFDSGTLQPGASFSQTFNTAGTIAYHCSIHPQMVASIVITEGAAAPAQGQAAPTAAAAGQAAAPSQVPATGVGTSALDARWQIALLAALAAVALAAAAVAYRRA
jgi:plastocyanin